MNKTCEDKKQIAAIKALAAAIDSEASAYSGRGMYGAYCWCVTCTDSDDVIERCREHGLPRPLVDNMGKGYVCYWPGIKCEQWPKQERTMEKKTCEVWLCVDESGDYSVGDSHEAAATNYQEEWDPDSLPPLRFIRLLIDVPLPVPVTLRGEAPAEGEAVLTAVEAPWPSPKELASSAHDCSLCGRAVSNARGHDLTADFAGVPGAE